MIWGLLRVCIKRVGDDLDLVVENVYCEGQVALGVYERFRVLYNSSIQSSDSFYGPFRGACVSC
jgi:hypothetical protein